MCSLLSLLSVLCTDTRGNGAQAFCNPSHGSCAEGGPGQQVVLFLLASHGTDFGRQPLGLNLIVLLVLVIAKLPALHKVRILGINKY